MRAQPRLKDALRGEPHASMARVPSARSSPCGYPSLWKPTRLLEAAPWTREESHHRLDAKGKLRRRSVATQRRRSHFDLTAV